MNNKIIIVSGDPNSINSEIIYKCWKKLNSNIKRKIYLIANYELIIHQLKNLKINIKYKKINNIDENINSSSLNIINIPLNFTDPFNVSLRDASNYVVQSLNLAHTLALSKKVKGIINCPIDKKLIKISNKIGVTEFLAAKCKVNNGSEVMMIHNKNFSVVPLTTHIDIKNVCKKINKALILKKITTLNKFFQILFKRKPKIGILGLNPHNSEFSKKSEEMSIIIPAIALLKKRKVNIGGPLVSDTLFINNYKKYDVVVGMYHDQVLTPFKALFHFNAINITLGLKYIRVSPDHGPAKDLIKKNKANYRSLYQCIEFINNLKK